MRFDPGFLVGFAGLPLLLLRLFFRLLLPPEPGLIGLSLFFASTHQCAGVGVASEVLPSGVYGPVARMLLLEVEIQLLYDCLQVRLLLALILCLSRGFRHEETQDYFLRLLRRVRYFVVLVDPLGVAEVQGEAQIIGAGDAQGRHGSAPL